MQLVVGLRFHSSATKDVDLDELWLALLSEFRHPGAHAPWLQVAATETAAAEPDSFASSTCNFNIIYLVHMEVLKNNAFPDMLTTR